MKRMLAILCTTLALCGCSSRDVVELNTENQAALATTDTFYVTPLSIAFRLPHAWEISDTEWKDWAAQWQLDFREELRTECFKSLYFTEPRQKSPGTTVTCTIYEMDRGGSGNLGSDGFARAHVVVKDANGKVIYDAKLEGTGANAGFEIAVIQGRLKFAILDLARQVADVLERG